MYTNARVPGLPIGDCARGCNNRDPTWPKLSAIGMTPKTFFERVYLVLGLQKFVPWVNCVPMHPQPRPSLYNYFLIHVQFFLRTAPLSFFQHDSPVIWPIPCTCSASFLSLMVTDTLTDMHFRKCMSVSVSVTIMAKKRRRCRVPELGQITGESCWTLALVYILRKMKPKKYIWKKNDGKIHGDFYTLSCACALTALSWQLN